MNDSSSIPPSLTAPHLSCKVYRCYFNYITKNYPKVDIKQICAESGLPYEYVANENNWVSVVFDERFTRLCIKHTGEPNLSYLAGTHAFSPDVLGTFVSVLLRHFVSLRLAYEQLPALTSAFSRVTQVSVKRSTPGHITLAFRPVLKSLSKTERTALRRNLDNIFQNTIGHYTGVPLAQGLPFATVSHKRDADAFGAWSIEVQYKSRGRMAEILTVVTPASTSTLTYAGLWVTGLPAVESFLWSILVAAVSLCLILFVRIKSIQAGTNEMLSSLREADQRYEDLHIAKNEIEKISKAYERFVPPMMLDTLGKGSISEVEYGDYIQREMSVLFADLRNFSAMAHDMSVTDTFRFLNNHLSRISPSIRKNQGFIDKYIGDGIMAIFPNSPQGCLNAAIEMVKVIRIYNKRRISYGKAPTHIGIGIHTGEMAFGTLGYPEQLQTTVISDDVNKAFRFQDYCKEFQASIITSQATLAIFDTSQLTYRFLATVRLKGNKESISIYQILNGVEPTELALYQETLQAFEEGVRAYEAGYTQKARACFAEVLAKNSADSAARLYHERTALTGDYMRTAA